MNEVKAVQTLPCPFCGGEYAGNVGAAQTPVLCQVRMAPTWRDDARRWTDWENCNAESAENYERITPYNDWEYEVRRLYAAPQPAQEVQLTLPDLKKALAIIEGDLVRLKNASFAAIESVALLRQAFATPQGIPALLERERCAIVAESGFRFAKDGYEIADEIRRGPNETNWSNS